MIWRYRFLFSPIIVFDCRCLRPSLLHDVRLANFHENLMPPEKIGVMSNIGKEKRVEIMNLRPRKSSEPSGRLFQTIREESRNQYVSGFGTFGFI